MRILFLSGAMLALAAGGAMAGTVITLDQSVNGGPIMQQTIALAADRMKMTSPQNHTIYRGDQNKVWIVRPEDKAYVELTPESMAQMKAMMDQKMVQMQQRLASLPPEERKQMEAMLASRGMGPSAPSVPPPVTYEKAGDPKKIGAYTCTPFRVKMPGVPDSEFCMAPLSELGLTRGDMQAFIGFGKFMSQMGGIGTQRSPMSRLDFDSIKKQIGFDGFPVQTSLNAPDVHYAVQTTLKSVEHDDPPTGTFDVPAGYIREDMGANMSHSPRAPG